MRDLIALALASPHIHIHGFYSHFGRELYFTLRPKIAFIFSNRADQQSPTLQLPQKKQPLSCEAKSTVSLPLPKSLSPSGPRLRSLTH